MTKDASNDPIQILTYIRRRQTLSPEQFYDHWENVHAGKVIPWAEKHGIIRYQQIHATGSIVPVPSTSSAPNAISTTPLPTTPVSFDGIAMFLVPSLEQFMEAFKDEYYIQVIEPDERVMLDKEGPGSGVLASFQGRMVGLVEGGKEFEGGDERRKVYRGQWEAFERDQQ